MGASHPAPQCPDSCREKLLVFCTEIEPTVQFARPARGTKAERLPDKQDCLQVKFLSLYMVTWKNFM